MLALVGKEPKVLNLLDMLKYYLLHQEDVVTRRTKYDLDKAEARAHILEGLLKALDHIDEIVQIIRSSENPNAAKTALIERFQFSDKQAQAILDMRLARLTGLEREKLMEEYQQLEKTIAELTAILADEHPAHERHQYRRQRLYCLCPAYGCCGSCRSFSGLPGRGRSYYVGFGA